MLFSSAFCPQLISPTQKFIRCDTLRFFNALFAHETSYKHEFRIPLSKLSGVYSLLSLLSIRCLQNGGRTSSKKKWGEIQSRLYWKFRTLKSPPPLLELSVSHMRFHNCQGRVINSIISSGLQREKKFGYLFFFVPSLHSILFIFNGSWNPCDYYTLNYLDITCLATNVGWINQNDHLHLAANAFGIGNITVSV